MELVKNLFRGSKRQKQVNSEGRKNTSGLAILPDELLLEVLSYFVPFPLLSPHPVRTTSKIIYPERRELLFALSGTCRNLRRFVYPYVWERIELYDGMRVGRPPRILDSYGADKDKRFYAKEIVRQLKVVTVKNPDFAQYVQVLNIDLTVVSVRSVFVKLARCLASFPNLHTVRIRAHVTEPSADRIIWTEAIRAFPRFVQHPQIRTAILSNPIFPLLGQCPNLQSFHAIGYYHSDLLRWLKKDSPHLQTLACRFIDVNDVELVSYFLPNLQEITIYLDGCLASSPDELDITLIKIVRRFRNLQTLVVEKSCLLVPSLTETLRDLPKRLSDKGLKRVIIREARYSRGLHVVEDVFSF